MSGQTPAPAAKSNRRTITVVAVALLAIAAILIGAFAFKQANPESEPIPTVAAPTSVAPSASEIQKKPVIPGANSGNKESTKATPEPSTAASPAPASSSPEPSIELADGYKPTSPDPQTGDERVDGPDIQIPGVGNPEDGENANLTKNTPSETRSSDGDPISKQLEAACPKITNGTLCLPSIKETIYWHGVGIRDSTTGSGKVMAVPSTYTAGWLNESAPPGAKRGTAVFAAHVIFRGGVEGPFYDLNKLQMGDDVIIRDLNGKNYTYRVYRITVTEGTELPDEVYNYQGTHQVALITCTGDYQDGHYNKRMVVWAAPVN